MTIKGGRKIGRLLRVAGGIIAGVLLMTACSQKNCAEVPKEEISTSYVEMPEEEILLSDVEVPKGESPVSDVGMPKGKVSVSHRVSFDRNSTWDRDSDEWNLNISTDETPRQGITLAMNVLLPVSDTATPSFDGRIRVLAALLLGGSEEWAQSDSVVELVSGDFSETVTIDGKRYSRTVVSVPFSDLVGTSVNGRWVEGVPFDQVVKQPVGKVKIFFAGRRCSYTGDIVVEDPYFTYDPGSIGDAYSVNSTVGRNDGTSLSVSGTALVTESGEQVSMDWRKVSLADKQANAAALKTYAYLRAVGASDHVIFGMEDELWSKSGAAPDRQNGLTGSDVEDMTGSNAGVLGMDALSLTGEEFSAVQYNSSFAVRNGLPAIDINELGNAAANVKAAAQVANAALGRGALVTLSCHMPDFVQVPETSDYRPGQDPSYAKYNFAASSARDLSGDPAHQILPGGPYNDRFNAYLDMIADYAKQVNGPILFRPFHEGEGSWFWWGASACDAVTYQKLFRYTVEYLRDKKQIHNLIYVYSADGDNTMGSAAAYERRYPGDDYVDVIGFDMYYKDPGADSDPWFSKFAVEVAAAQKFAGQHGKAFAVTETGIMRTVPAQGDVATALSRSGNPEKQWFEKVLNVLSDSEASYCLTWTNNTELFHVPYVKAVKGDGSLYGHEMIDGFMEFFNDKRSVFAVNQRQILASLCGTVSLSGDEEAGVSPDSAAGSGLTWTENTEQFHVPYVQASSGNLYGQKIKEYFNSKKSASAADQRQSAASSGGTVSLWGHKAVNEQDPNRSYYYVVPQEQFHPVTSIEVTFTKDGSHYVWAVSADGTGIDLPQEVYGKGTYVIPVPAGTSEIGFNVFTSEIDMLNLNIPGEKPAATSHSGRYLSILGDSFSVSDAWRSDNNDRDAFTALTKWWFAAAKAYDMNILVNNSVSATGISLDSQKGAGDSGLVRCTALHTAARTPDDIFVLLGVNDMFSGKDFSVIHSEYGQMVASMKKRYPNASITLFTYPYVGTASTGESIAANVRALNDVIRQVAAENNLGLVDLSECGITAENVGRYTRASDDIHYNRAGQELIGKKAIAGLKAIWD